MIRCECCGGHVDDAPSAEQIIVACRLSGREMELLRIVYDADGVPVKSIDIIDRICSGQIDGGPLNHAQVVSHLKARTNAKIERIFPHIVIKGTVNGFMLIVSERRTGYERRSIGVAEGYAECG